MYDAAIIGSGPAGLSAAINLKLHNKSIIWFGSRDLSDKVEKSEIIANYPGFDMVTGEELNSRFLSQIASFNIEITEKTVTNIGATKKGYTLLADNEIYQSRTVIFAVGAVAAKGLDGEERLLGRGVSYCATCDGFLYRGKIIAVYCAAKRFEHEVKYLADMAKKVYLYTPYNDCEVNLDNVEKLTKPMREVCGEERADSVCLTDGTRISVDGVFFLRNAVRPSVLLSGIETQGAHIRADRQCRTNKKGCFAAGDCTGRPYQIAKAVGEGNIAAHSALEYLDTLEKNEI
ncbi:MAG: NAD(P)/FAD-dependent oxidoreductase [Acutalibacteraceae bacterium]